MDEKEFLRNVDRGVFIRAEGSGPDIRVKYALRKDRSIIYYLPLEGMGLREAVHGLAMEGCAVYPEELRNYLCAK